MKHRRGGGTGRCKGFGKGTASVALGHQKKKMQSKCRTEVEASLSLVHLPPGYRPAAGSPTLAFTKDSFSPGP